MMKKKFHFTVDCDWIPNSERALPRLFSIIEELNLKPTFFLTGKFAKEYNEFTSEIFKRGYEIGCHGLNHGLDPHENFGEKQSYDNKKRYLAESTEIIEKIIGCKPIIFRAPRFQISNNTFSILSELDYRIDSSLAVKRFDFGLGTMNNAKNIYKKNETFFIYDSILEIPPSAFILPLNMRLIRIFGVKIAAKILNLVKMKSNLIVFYLHPAEFVSTAELKYPILEKSFYNNCGSHNFELLESFLISVLEENLISEKMSVHLER